MHLDITTRDYKTLKYLLNAYLPGTTVWAFGSRVKFTSKPESDLDLVIITPQKFFLVEVKSAFAESDLPFKVDILKWDTIPDNFKKNIEKEYVVVQGLDDEKVHLPPTWTKYKLGVIAKDIAMGPFGSNLKVDNFIDKGVPVIRGMNLNNGGLTNNSFAFVSEEKANSLKRCLAYPDDLVFTHRGTLGQVAIIPYNAYPKYLVSQSQMRLAVNKDILNPRFLYYFFKSPLGQKELLKNSSQVGVPAIANPTKSLKDVNISIPDLKAQTEIASILSSLDEKIELNQQMNQTLENMAQAIFKEWFVNFNFPGFDGELVDGLPKGWKKGKLAEDFNLTMGQSPLGESLNKTAKGTVFYQGRTDFGFRFPENRIYTIEPNRMANKLDTLVSVRAPVGDINMAVENCCIGRGLSAVRHKSGSHSYTYYSMKNIESVFKGFESEGTVFGSINKANFENIDILIPDENVVQKFELVANTIDEKILNNSLEIHSLIDFRDSLLPRLMTAKIEVNA